MAVSRMSLVLGALALGGGGCALIDALAFSEETAPEPVGEGGAAHGGAGHGGTAAHGGTGGTGGTGGVVFEKVRLLAINPPIMTHGGAVWLEGEFEPGVATTADLGQAEGLQLGPESVHRRVLDVPDSGFTGDMVVHSGGEESWPLPVRVTPFLLGITRFQDHHPQTAYGRGMPVLDLLRAGHTAQVLGQHVYLIGGHDEVRLSRAWINADSSLSRFTTEGTPSLAEGRSGHMSVRLARSLFVLGGEAGGAALDSVEQAELNQASEPQQFSSLGDVQLTAARVNAALAVIGRYVYVFGGLGVDGNPLGSIERAAHIPGEQGQPGTLSSFEPVANVSLAMPRAGHTVQVVGQHVIVIGGSGESGPLGNLEMFAIQGSAGLETHNGQRPELQQARQDHTSILLGDKLYVFGGSAYGSELGSVERVWINSGGSFDDGQQFETLGFTMAQARAGASSVVAGNDLYLFGGTVGGSETRSVSRASLVGEADLVEWSSQNCTLDQNRADHVVAADSGQIHVLGGARGQGGQGGSWPTNDTAGTSVSPDGALPDVFAATAQSPTPRRGACVVVTGGEMWVLGGETEQGGLSNLAESASFDGNQLGTFGDGSVAALSSARRDAACVVLKDRLYIIGGHDGSGPIATVEYMPLDAHGGAPADEWTSGGTLQTARAGHAVAVVGSQLHVIGGTGAGASPVPIAYAVETALIHDVGSLDTFVHHSASHLLEPRAHPAAAVLGPWLYVLGGDGPMSPSYVQRAAFDADGSGAINDFSSVPALDGLGTRERHAAILLSDHLHVLGGYQQGAGGGGGGDAYLNTVISAQLTPPPQ